MEKSMLKLGEIQQILTTYKRLHKDKVFAHWMWSAIERIASGEDESTVMWDYGYQRVHNDDSRTS